ncbi:hypothetical protein QBC44DRAFT_59613 [Cladorrhinum sp. PSN332]|nr:hypothetical protein QBC44DRAFT_59613 [Cladorrhinum sp. PSN332]
MMCSSARRLGGGIYLVWVFTLLWGTVGLHLGAFAFFFVLFYYHGNFGRDTILHIEPHLSIMYSTRGFVTLLLFGVSKIGIVFVD